jgi:RNA:NAD 2'-phosphotransferase (TPT1/KptA family)
MQLPDWTETRSCGRRNAPRLLHERGKTLSHAIHSLLRNAGKRHRICRGKKGPTEVTSLRGRKKKRHYSTGRRDQEHLKRVIARASKARIAEEWTRTLLAPKEKVQQSCQKKP